MSVLTPRMPLSAAAKFCHRLGMGLHAGADLLKLLNSESAHGSLHQRKAMLKLADGAKRGEQLSDVMEEEKPYFPPLMTAMTRTGEATGKLEQALLTLAEHFDQQLKIAPPLSCQSIAWPMLQFVIAGILRPLPGDLHSWAFSHRSGVARCTTFSASASAADSAEFCVFWGYIAIFFGIHCCVWSVGVLSHNVAGIQNLVPLVYMVPKHRTLEFKPSPSSRFCWTMALALDALDLTPIRSIRLALDSTGQRLLSQRGAEDAEQAIHLTARRWPVRWRQRSCSPMTSSCRGSRSRNTPERMPSRSSI